MAGPLSGIKIVEFTGLGPGPFCAMMLADAGAEVIRIDKTSGISFPNDPLARSRKSIAIDMKSADGIKIARELVKTADGIIEGFRPNVMERLGLGPDVLLADNPKLVYGRMTGWGQTGPLSHAAGHDINYIALSGILHTCGRAGQKPTPPVNYIGDFGGGGMVLAFGMVSALLAVKNGAPGQVIDCAMTDGSAVLSTMSWMQYNSGQLVDKAGVNLLDTGAHFYDVYETSDEKYVAIGSIEPQFYQQLLAAIGMSDDGEFKHQFNKPNWPNLKIRMEEIFKSKTRDEWCTIMEGTDICFAPVLSLTEAPNHPHNIARETFIEVDGFRQPAPAPKYSVTVNDAPKPAPKLGENSLEILSGLGYSDTEIKALLASKTIK